ncbi:beta-1,6-N-acetylglucosaminyltransferase [Marinilactibacillus sp. XAAS-LB27]|uniref:beta-1,6-N-acetylglucosaminyltransferase n=1 Tax=Marinilactibacillus sp. XAAS-LB27 TaxID=3114538 RepID=UPI002E180BC1|nr:beta-1,6-N-acetylglucosaminyltransferase [Marinilactibacillus sp. XAAS-LB27]
MDKHAYLIMAHEYNETLITLLKALDDVRNDIFIHIDKKSHGFNYFRIKNTLGYSELIFTENIEVNWGGYSQIKCEMILLRAAANHKKYSNYHLISGSDLPTKSQDFIHSFFQKNQNKNFVGFNKNQNMHKDRTKYYYFFQELKPRQNNLFFKIIERVSLFIQKLFRINRNSEVNFKKGPNWFSLTHSFVQYVILNEEWIEKTFKNTLCGDELYIQTLIYNSGFRDNIYEIDCVDDNRATMRHIDWVRGNPYRFESDDFVEVFNNDMLFARKFESNVQFEKIELYLKK